MKLIYSRTDSPDLFTAYSGADLGVTQIIAVPPVASRSVSVCVWGVLRNGAVVSSPMCPCPVLSPSIPRPLMWAAR